MLQWTINLTITSQDSTIGITMKRESGRMKIITLIMERRSWAQFYLMNAEFLLNMTIRGISMKLSRPSLPKGTSTTKSWEEGELSTTPKWSYLVYRRSLGSSTSSPLTQFKYSTSEALLLKKCILWCLSLRTSPGLRTTTISIMMGGTTGHL